MKSTTLDKEESLDFLDSFNGTDGHERMKAFIGWMSNSAQYSVQAAKEIRSFNASQDRRRHQATKS